MCHFIERSTDISSCGVCLKNVQSRHRSLKCSICKSLFHIKCNKIDARSYESLKGQEFWICLLCNKDIYPFFPTDHNEKPTKNYQSASNSIKSFFKGINEFNDLGQNNKDDDDNVPLINCTYEDIESFKLKKTDKELSFFHLNIASLSKHKEELETSLSLLKHKFDIIALTETRIKNNATLNYDINLNGYNVCSTPTESDKGGTLIYITNSLKYRERKDLDEIMYKEYDLEATFLEIINTDSKNIICGCIYRHPKMDLDDFNINHLNKLLEKINKEKKSIFLLGDFNVDLMNTDKDSNTENFFDCLTSHLLVPHIIYPTRITHHSKTLIDNIFSNSTNYELGKSGNLTLSISDHLAQFLVLPKSHVKNKVQNKTTYRDMSNFNKEQMLNDLSNIDWNSAIDLQKNDPSFSYNSFENTVNKIVDNHIPIKTISKRKLKIQSKPWITKGIKKSIVRREKLYKNYLNTSNLERKQQLREDYKNIRNQIVTLCRNSKKLHYQSHFTKNATNSRNIWKGINSIIHLKDTHKKSIDSISTANGITNEPKEIANSFNEYFSSSKFKIVESFS